MSPAGEEGKGVRSATLGVLESTRAVLDQAEHVSLDPAALEERCAEWAARPWPVPAWDQTVHFGDGGPRTANYLLLLDALNFCFWPDPGQPRWEIDYRGRRLGGYQALAAALRRALEEGVPLTEASWMARVEAGQLAHVLRGSGPVPLFEHRLAHTRETGRVLLERFGGQFARAIEEAAGSALALVRLVEEHFPSFRDLAEYRGSPVRFLKRAQILAADLYGAFGGSGLGRFEDLEHLTAFADYKVPQVLHALGILRYSPELCDRLRRQVPIAPGDPLEVEIRAGTVWAVEEIRRRLAARGRPLRAFEIDWHLWNLGQTPLPGQLPYHRTRTVFY